jgi:hypothetical protein
MRGEFVGIRSMSSIGLATIINGPLVFGPTDMTAATSAATMGSRQTAVIFSMLWFWSVNMTNGIKRPQATNTATPPPGAHGQCKALASQERQISSGTENSRVTVTASVLI